MMSSGYRLPYKWVKIYTLTLLACACLGNDFLKFSLYGLPFNPYRLVGLAAPLVLAFASTPFWKTLWRGEKRWYAGFSVMLGFYALCSGLWAPDRSAWVTHGLFLGYGVLTTLLVLGCADDRRSVVRMIRVCVWCAVFVAVGATFEILSGHYGFNRLYAGDYLWARGKSFMHLPLPVFTMGNVNDLGAYLFFALGAVLWLMPAARGQVWRFGRWRLPANGLYAAVACLFLFLMLCTQSRAVFLGLILAGMAGFGCWLSRRPPHWKVWFGLAVGLTVLLAVGFVLFWQYDAPADKADHSDAVRLGVIRNAWLFSSRSGIVAWAGGAWIITMSIILCIRWASCRICTTGSSKYYSVAGCLYSWCMCSFMSARGDVACVWPCVAERRRGGRWRSVWRY